MRFLSGRLFKSDRQLASIAAEQTNNDKEAPAVAKSENVLIGCRNMQLMTTGKTASTRQPCYPEMLQLHFFTKG
jgi:hypothetical protein